MVHKESGNTSSPVIAARISFITADDSRNALKLDGHVFKGKKLSVVHLLGTRAVCT